MQFLSIWSASYRRQVSHHLLSFNVIANYFSNKYFPSTFLESMEELMGIRNISGPHCKCMWWESNWTSSSKQSSISFLEYFSCRRWLFASIALSRPRIQRNLHFGLWTIEWAEKLQGSPIDFHHLLPKKRERTKMGCGTLFSDWDGISGKRARRTSWWSAFSRKDYGGGIIDKKAKKRQAFACVLVPENSKCSEPAADHTLLTSSLPVGIVRVS